ncbi:MAG: FAD-dependent oxidoreductase [bacterium]|nr:FAD-dependent oxidoreductase [bacterium]
MREEKVQVVVVGGGPAGLAASMAAAAAGAEVLLLERGNFSGAKNVIGGILFTPPLERLIPGFRQADAPLERPVARRSFSILSEGSSADLSFRCGAFADPPYNGSFTVLRAPFDRWLSKKAEEAGVEIFNGVVVEGLLRDARGRVTGVKTRVDEGADSGEGELFSEVVILAEGANALIAEKEGFRPKMLSNEMAVAVKEVIALPEEVIQDRFCLEDAEGEGREYYGEAVAGMFGSGFIYTNRESVSVGVAVSVADLAKSGLSPNDLLEGFKSHPSIRPLLKSGETVEYSAHMIPEGGYNRMGRLFADGILVVGDAAGLVNVSPYHEGINLAVASGMAAGETAAEAVAKGDTSADVMKSYRERLEESFVLKDLKKFAGFPGYLKENPQLLSVWPGVFLEMLREVFTVSGEPKQEMENRAAEMFSREIGVLSFLRTVFQGVGAMDAFHLETVAPFATILKEGAGSCLNATSFENLAEYFRRNW